MLCLHVLDNIMDPSTLFSNGLPITAAAATAAATVNYGFGSEAVNLEYSILSNMLSSASTAESLGGGGRSSGNSGGVGGVVADMGMIENNWQHHPSLQRTNQIVTAPGGGGVVGGVVGGGVGIGGGVSGINGGNSNPPPPPKRESLGKRKMYSNTPENVYTNVKKPFSYTEGFHYLVKWVRDRYLLILFKLI